MNTVSGYVFFFFFLAVCLLVFAHVCYAGDVLVRNLLFLIVHRRLTVATGQQLPVSWYEEKCVTLTATDLDSIFSRQTWSKICLFKAIALS